MIAALYVDPKGTYANLEGVECWGLPDRDAREYAGPWPVVAHPPCARWCRLAHAVQGRTGHRVGDDGGCFEAALASVRRWGGVLEHPADSKAWARYGLINPPRFGGWARDFSGAWVCQVDQSQYGHQARKSTWLYLVGAEPPSMRWGPAPAGTVTRIVGHDSKKKRPTTLGRLWGKATSATPPEFRDVLISIARSTYGAAERIERGEHHG